MIADTLQVRALIREAAKTLNCTIYDIYTDKKTWSTDVSEGDFRYVGAWLGSNDEALAKELQCLFEKNKFSNPVRCGNGYVRTNSVLA